MKKLILTTFVFIFTVSLMNVSAINFNQTLSEHESSEAVVDEDDAVQADALGADPANEDARDIPTSGYVDISGGHLNVRSEPWGDRIGSLSAGDEVSIIGAEGEWYQISFNGQTAYVHARYISQENNQGVAATGDQGTPPVQAAARGSVQQNVVDAAQQLLEDYSEPYSFPYDPLTNNGRKGCAQVVSTALVAAGVDTGIQLGVVNTINILRDLGWQEVEVPPYQAGDVVTWATYDRNGNGQDDPDTHIGIVMTNGNNVQVMNNGSAEGRPLLKPVNYKPVTKVLRKI